MNEHVAVTQPVAEPGRLQSVDLLVLPDGHPVINRPSAERNKQDERQAATESGPSFVDASAGGRGEWRSTADSAEPDGSRAAPGVQSPPLPLRIARQQG